MQLRRLFAMALVAVCATAGTAYGQSQAINGTIEGTVKDSSGAVLPGVTVTVTNTSTGAQRVVVSNESGVFRPDRESRPIAIRTVQTTSSSG